MIDVENEETSRNSSYRSIFSRGSMINRMEGMHVRRDEMSASNSGKRKNEEFEVDSATSAVKRSRTAN